MNASCEKYDGSDVFGKFPILEKYLVDDKNVEKKNKLTQNILEYKLCKQRYVVNFNGSKIKVRE